MVQNESPGFETKLYRGPPPVTLILWLLFSLSPNNSKYSCQSNFSFTMFLCFPKIYLYCPVYIQLNTEHFHTLSWSSMSPVVSDPTQRMHIGLVLNFVPLSNITPLPPTQVILYCLHPFWCIPPSVENDSSHLFRQAFRSAAWDLHLLWFLLVYIDHHLLWNFTEYLTNLFVLNSFTCSDISVYHSFQVNFFFSQK